MYNLIYDFLHTYLFNNNYLGQVNFVIGGASLNMTQWLCHTTTIICIGLIIYFAIMFIIWLFKFVSNLFIR